MISVVGARVRRGVLAMAALLVCAVLPGQLSSAPPAEAWYRDPCGVKVLKSTGGYWACTFADDFTGTALDTSKWAPITTSMGGYTSGGECYTSSRNNVAVASGTLRLTVRKEAAPFTCTSPRGDFTTDVTGGYVSTWSKFSQTYGRFEFRAKFPAAKVAGLQSALWLWPVNPSKYGATWPSSGEIDVAEFYTNYPDRVIPYVHYVGNEDDPNRTNTNCMVPLPEAWHTYVLEWTPQAIVVKIDGKVCIRDVWSPDGVVSPAPFDHPFYVNLTQMLGIHSNRTADGTTAPLPATMQVDYVRVWR